MPEGPSPMGRALAMAAGALYRSSPNPRVGCVIADASGSIVGQGSTQAAGGPHAEVMALRDTQAQGRSIVGATAYVTLEPCSHHGRTGPCCDALIEAGIARVVAAVVDPNPLVSGNGLERLRAAGVAVEVGPGAAASRELNIGFFSRMLRHKPWVRMKVAASLDGFTALKDGTSQWITGQEARRDGHHWRARSCVILTGIGTVLSDNPSLDVREIDTPRQPKLAVVDSHLRTPINAALFLPAREVLIYYADAPLHLIKALEQRGASLVAVPDSNGQVDLAAMLLDLAQRGTNEVHIEAGATLNGALLRQGLVDECLVYLAPMLLGEGIGMAQMNAFPSLSQAQRFRFGAPLLLGEDVRLIARGLDSDKFLATEGVYLEP